MIDGRGDGREDVSPMGFSQVLWRKMRKQHQK